MAKFAVTDAVVTIGGTDYSDEISEFNIEINADAQDSTNFASAGWTEMVRGLRSYSVSITFKKDSDLSGLDLAIWTEMDTGDSIAAWTGKVDNAATSASNPIYSGSLFISQWSPVAGSVGQLYGGSVTWQGTGAITRATA